MTIVYRSNAGTTRRYAELLGEQTGCDVLELAKAKDTVADDVVYLGWIMADEIQGLAEAKACFDLAAVAGVGMMDDETNIAKVREKAALDTAEFFFLPGDFHIENVTGMLKLAMGVVRKAMRAEVKKSGDPEAAKTLERIENGVDKFDETALAPLTAFIKARQSGD